MSKSTDEERRKEGATANGVAFHVAACSLQHTATEQSGVAIWNDASLGLRVPTSGPQSEGFLHVGPTLRRAMRFATQSADCHPNTSPCLDGGVWVCNMSLQGTRGHQRRASP